MVKKVSSNSIFFASRFSGQRHREIPDYRGKASFEEALSIINMLSSPAPHTAQLNSLISVHASLKARGIKDKTTEEKTQISFTTQANDSFITVVNEGKDFHFPENIELNAETTGFSPLPPSTIGETDIITDPFLDSSFFFPNNGHDQPPMFDSSFGESLSGSYEFLPDNQF